MAIRAHLETLQQRHQELDTAIAAELKHPSYDETRIHELKRLKLRIKDQIHNISTQSVTH